MKSCVCPRNFFFNFFLSIYLSLSLPFVFGKINTLIYKFVGIFADLFPLPFIFSRVNLSDWFNTLIALMCWCVLCLGVVVLCFMRIGVSALSFKGLNGLQLGWHHVTQSNQLPCETRLIIICFFILFFFKLKEICITRMDFFFYMEICIITWEDNLFFILIFITKKKFVIIIRSLFFNIQYLTVL